MKRFLVTALLTGLLLCGCGVEQTAETPAPTETTEATQAPAEPVTLLEGTEGDLSTYVLDSGSCAGLLRMGERYALLTTGGQLFLLSGEALTVENSCDLGCGLTSDDPSIVVMEDRISYFDPQRAAYVTLGKNLTEISAVTIRDQIVGKPIMSPDFSTIYYCTADVVRAMDMATGNSRLLRQEHSTIADLDGLLFDGTILRYTRQVGENETQTCFIRTADGSQTYLADLDGQLTTWGQNYAAEMNLSLPMGSQRRILTGSVGGKIQTCQIPEDYDTALFPGDGLLLLQTVKDSALLLQVYDLNTGLAAGQLELKGRGEPFPRAWKDADDLWLWSDDGRQFFRWDLSGSQRSGESVLTGLSTLTQPDQAGLDEASALAEAMSGQFGITIRLTESANRTTGVDYSGYPDYRPTQYTEALNRLQTALEVFPEDFFPQLTKNAELVIELVDDFDPAMGSYTGTGGLEIAEPRIIRVSMCQDLEAIFYHELFHAMELFLYSETNDLENWSDENPGDFEYSGAYQEEYEASEYLAEGENAFADGYCMVSPREDRAQTFMYAMLADQSARFRSETMQEKLELLSEAIRDAFRWKKSEEAFLWEQYLQD